MIQRLSSARTAIGLTRREREVMDLWDSGEGSNAIARQLGLSKEAVSSILANYAGAEHEAKSLDSAIRAASARLAAACLASGGRFL